MEQTTTSGVLLTDVLDDLRAKAVGDAGRAAHTLFGGRDNRLRQTVVYMREGHELAEHSSPGDAALHVLEGSVSLHMGEESLVLSAGEVMSIPPVRHSVTADVDSAFILTVALHSDWSEPE